MSQNNGLFTWRVIGKAIVGSAHIRQGLPRQDEIGWWPEEIGAGLPLVLAVSDGHGSEAHFRSNIGAKYAVDAAIDILGKFSEVSEDENDPEIIVQNAQRNLAREIHRKWLDLVADDVYRNPISHEELTSLEMSKGISRMRQVILQPTLAYGATLLCTLVVRNYILYLQLGDGDILSVGDDARVERIIPKDKELVGDETTSLCLPNAWREFRVALTLLSKNLPSLIIMCTDGYSNSFADDDAFLKIGPDYLKWIKDKGLNVVNDNLGMWLSAASAGGSGDDVTVGIIYRTETSREPSETSSIELKETIASESENELDKNLTDVIPGNGQEGDRSQTGEVGTRNE